MNKILEDKKGNMAILQRFPDYILCVILYNMRTKQKHFRFSKMNIAVRLLKERGYKVTRTY